MNAARRLAVVGLGLIGGSVALAARAAGAAAEIVGVDVDPEARRLALSRGAADRVTADLAEGVAGADLVVLAVPPRTALRLAEPLARAVSPGALVTDVASTKRAIVERYGAALAGRARFVGGHPLAGSERSGLAAARADLFRGATWFLTPAAPDLGATAAVSAWVRRLGAEPLVLEAPVHDALLAAASHLPQIGASALAAAVAALVADPAAALGVPPARLVGPGFRDTTRLAGSDPDLWVDIALTNADNILSALERLVLLLGDFRRALAAGDAEALRGWFRAATAARRLTAGSPGTAAGGEPS